MVAITREIEPRKLIGFSPKLWDDAVTLLNGDEDAVVPAYNTWKKAILTLIGGKKLSTHELAKVLGITTDYVAQLKFRRMLTWSDVLDNKRGYFYTRDDVEKLFDLSENWLRGGSDAVGGAGTRGPLAHVFVRYLQKRDGKIIRRKA